MLGAAASGLLTGLTLIVAIGAQNAYVLRQGLLRSHVLVLVAFCALSDAVLIVAGVGGFGVVVEHAGWVLTVLRWFGVAFLVWYGLSSLRRAFRPGRLDAADSGPAPLRTALLTVAAFTWLNPHVYLDTVVLLGSIASTHGGDRWWFGLGAAVGSVVWFGALGFGARLLAPLFARQRTWQVLDVLIGVVMIALAVKLALG